MREKGWEERGPKAHSKNSDFGTPVIYVLFSGLPNIRRSPKKDCDQTCLPQRPETSKFPKVVSLVAQCSATPATVAATPPV